MKAVILAAGEGIRMRPLTINTPKPLLKILGKPILEHIIDSFPNEINEIVIVVGYLRNQIKNYFGSNWKGRKINYIFQKDKRGTAHALWLCKPFFKNERFLLTMGDDLHSPSNIKRCIQKDLSHVVAEVGNVKRFGEIILNKDGSIKHIIEKPENPLSKLGSTGAMVLNDKIFNYKAEKHPNGEYFLTDCINKMAKDHKIYAVVADFWIPIAYPEDLKKAEKVLRKKLP